MSHDQKCFDLATYFLPTATVVVKAALADELQAVIEDFLENIDDRAIRAWAKP